MSGGQIQSNGAGGIIRGEFVQNSNIRFLAYLVKANGAVLSDVNVQGFITVQVYQRSGATPNTAIYTDTTTYTAASAIAGTGAISLDGWTRGGEGHNFDLTIPSTVFTQQGGMDYRFKFTIQLQPSGNMTVIFDLFCRSAGA
jgi:hypothetical protein